MIGEFDDLMFFTWFLVLNDLESTNPHSIWCLGMDWKWFGGSKNSENRRWEEIIRRYRVWVFIGSKNRSKIKSCRHSVFTSVGDAGKRWKTLKWSFKAFNMTSDVGKMPCFGIKTLRVVNRVGDAVEDAGSRQQSRGRCWGRWRDSTFP